MAPFPDAREVRWLRAWTEGGEGVVVPGDVRSPSLVDARSVHRGVTREEGGGRVVRSEAERARGDGTLYRRPGGAPAQGLGRGGGRMVVPGEVRSPPIVDARSVHRGGTREEEGHGWWARRRKGCGGIGPTPVDVRGVYEEGTKPSDRKKKEGIQRKAGHLHRNPN